MKRSILTLLLLALVSVADAKTVSVGYQPGMEKNYIGAWAALDQGRREAQQEWSKWTNIAWTGSSRPNLYIRPTGSSSVWGYYQAPNAIYVTYSRKVWKTDAQWKDLKAWKSLFLHELGHYFVLPRTHCNNPVGAGKCLMTIQGGRQSQLCSSCLKKLQAKWGKPKARGEGEVDEKPEALPVLEPAMEPELDRFREFLWRRSR